MRFSSEVRDLELDENLTQKLVTVHNEFIYREIASSMVGIEVIDLDNVGRS